MLAETEKYSNLIIFIKIYPMIRTFKKKRDCFDKREKGGLFRLRVKMEVFRHLNLGLLLLKRINKNLAYP